MLHQCSMHKENICTAEYLLLPFPLSRLLLWRTVLNFRVCRQKTKIGVILHLLAVCHVSCQPGTDRTPTARMRSLHSAIDGPSACVCLSSREPDQLHFSLCVSAAGSFTVRSPRSRDIIEARRFKNVYKQSEESENGHQIMPGVWPTGEGLFDNEWYIFVFLFKFLMPGLLSLVCCVLQ